MPRIDEYGQIIRDGNSQRGYGMGAPSLLTPRYAYREAEYRGGGSIVQWILFFLVFLFALGILADLVGFIEIGEIINGASSETKSRIEKERILYTREEFRVGNTGIITGIVRENPRPGYYFLETETYLVPIELRQGERLLNKPIGLDITFTDTHGRFTVNQIILLTKQ